MSFFKFIIFLMVSGLNAGEWEQLNSSAIREKDGKTIMLLGLINKVLIVKYNGSTRDTSFGENGRVEIPSRGKNFSLGYNPETGSIFVQDWDTSDLLVFDKNGRLKPELTKSGGEFGSNLLPEVLPEIMPSQLQSPPMVRQEGVVSPHRLGPWAREDLPGSPSNDPEDDQSDYV